MFLLFLAAAFLYGDIEEHFKRASGKFGAHSMRNIDYIYLINLDQRPEKYQMSLAQLAPYGIEPYRFSAVNGWELSLEAINDVGVRFSPEMEGGFMASCYRLDGEGKPSHELVERYGETYFVHCMPRGGIGCALSHLSVLQDAFDAGYQTIWVMEDDIEVLQNPHRLSDLIDQLDLLVGSDGWDILFTDRDFRNGQGLHVPAYGAAKRPDCAALHLAKDFSFKTDISPQFRQIANRYGTTSMIIRRSGMKKLLQFFKAHQIYLPYDMDLIYANGIRIFTVSEDVVSNLPQAISDLGGPYYTTIGQSLGYRTR
ncbi:MAG: glycosyltransferase family 25 protein [Chlamydiales bacterium]